MARIFGHDGPFSVLVRPDGYVADIRNSGSAELVGEYFATIIGLEA